MSMLLGPLSETMRSVSWRDCALAGDQTAGAAGSTPPAAIAVTLLRNSRRFIGNLHGNEHSGLPQTSCQRFMPRRLVLSACDSRAIGAGGRPHAFVPGAHAACKSGGASGMGKLGAARKRISNTNR